MDFRVVVLGTDEHARVALDILESEKRHFHVEGFIDVNNNQEIWGKSLARKPIFGGPDQLDKLFSNGVQYAVVAVADNSIRGEFFEDVERRGFNIPGVVHPMAAVSKNAYVGKGASISAGAVINAGAWLGRGVIVKSGATVDHDSRLSNFVFVAPGAHIGGHVTVGEGAIIGLGACIAHPDGKPINIGKGSIVAAGAVVTKDVADGITVQGNPARKKPERKRRAKKTKSTKSKKKSTAKKE